MSVWDTATPAGSDPISQGDDRIRELKVALQDALRGGAADGTEAVFPGAAPSSAPVFHYRGLIGTTASRPAATEGGLYANTTTGTIQRANGSSWVDITENAAYEAIHQAAPASLASVSGVVTVPETGNSFNVTGTEAVTSIAGWSAGVVIVKWASARTLTHNGSTLYLKNALSRAVAANDVSIFEFTGSNAVREISFYGAAILPTRQTFLSGSGTYTTPADCRQLRVRMIGGGGGGGGNYADGATGGAGGSTSFNSIVAAGGSGGSGFAAASTLGGAGGTGGSGSATLRLQGGGGGGKGIATQAAGAGGNGAFGGGAPGLGRVTAAGQPGATNTGGGGGGANEGDSGGGAGGGSGEYVELTISNPSATYAYAVGAAGAAGAGGSFAGGAGGSGIIIVDELY